MPFPSPACRTCKIRRIKCDGAQPVCQKCVRSQRVCHGMNTGEGGFDIHIENQYASGLKKRPRGPRSAPLSKSNDNLGPILRHPSVNLKAQAIVYYLHHNIQLGDEPPSVLKSIHDDVLPLWISNAKSPTFELAISSIALAVFSRAQNCIPAAREASINHQQLLKISQVMLASLNGDNIDTCLLSIFLIGQYEDASHRQNNLDPKTPLLGMALKSIPHFDGALATLKFWRHNLSHLHPATDVIKHTRRSLIKLIMIRNLEVPEWIMDGSSFGEHGLDLENDTITVRIANLRWRLYTLLLFEQRDSSDMFISTLEELDKEAQTIDEAMEAWASHLPNTWYSQKHILPDHHLFPMDDFFSEVVYSYSNRSYASIWSKHYAMRLLLNGTRLKVLEMIYSTDESQHKQLHQCVSLVNAVAKDLASTIPFVLKRFQVNACTNKASDKPSIDLCTEDDIAPYLASRLAWPLAMASSIGKMDASQRLWFESYLKRLGKTVGTGFLQCAAAEKWLRI